MRKRKKAGKPPKRRSNRQSRSRGPTSPKARKGASANVSDTPPLFSPSSRIPSPSPPSAVPDAATPMNLDLHAWRDVLVILRGFRHAAETERTADENRSG